MIEKIALQAAWNQRENIFKIFGAFSFLCALPVLFMLMLPSAVFGDFTLNTDIFNNNSLIAENLIECENAVWSAVNESHKKIIDEIYAKIDLLGENEIGILDDTFVFSDINTDLILCQYSSKTNFKYINSVKLMNLF